MQILMHQQSGQSKAHRDASVHANDFQSVVWPDLDRTTTHSDLGYICCQATRKFVQHRAKLATAALCYSWNGLTCACNWHVSGVQHYLAVVVFGKQTSFTIQPDLA